MPKEKNFARKLFFYINAGFGLGLIPKAPGSFGTLLGFGIYILIADLSLSLFLVSSSVGFLLSLFLIQYAQSLFNEVDDKRVVIDEFFAFTVLLYFIPNELLYWIIAYILFRFFDIVKPFPIKWVDKKIKTPFGVMFDDLLAALYSYVVIFIIISTNSLT